MSFITDFRYRIAAALSPKQMTGQVSRPNIKNSRNNWLTWNGDDLTHEDYDKMLRDPQIKSGYELIRMFLLSRKLVITPGDDTPEQEEISDRLDKMLHSMDYPLRKVRNDLYSALPYGFSISEIVWNANEDGSIDIKRIRPIPIDTLTDPFIYDDNGDLEMIVQEDPEGGGAIEIAPDKCLVYTYDESFGDRRGTSILDSVYDNWFMKQKLLQWWNIYLQKHEGPSMAAFIDNPQMKGETQDAMDDVHEGRANLTLGKEDRLEIIESSHRGEGFKDAINYHDVMIYRKMNIGTMILGQESGKGAYAQSQTQFDTLSIFLDGVHEDIAAELQIKTNEWCDMHYNNLEVYPQVGFETFEEKDLLELIKTLDLLVKDLAVDPSDKWFKQVVGEVVSRYCDVDLSEYLQEEEAPNPQQVTPTPEEQKAPLPEQQTQMIEDINKAFTLPGQETNQ
jgi:hypothetical protein